MNAVLDELRFNHRATGRPRGRAPACYLRRDGYEAAAEWVKKRLLTVKGPHLVEIRDDGGVRLTERRRLAADDYNARTHGIGYVGTYNRAALTEHIKDDLQHWLRQAKA